MTLNSHTDHGVRRLIRAACRRTRSLATAVTAVTLSSIIAILVCIMPPGNSAFANTGAAGAPSSTGTSNTPPVSITIDEATAVVTATSGYTLKATVHNTSHATLTAGTVTLATNVFYTFVSRTDIQQWAQGETGIPVNDVLGTATIPSIAANASAGVSITVPPKQQELASIITWGPKPLLVTYKSGAASTMGANAHTFLTRSSDGLKTAKTPPLNLTVAMPLASNAWQMDDAKVKELLADSAKAKTASGSVTGLPTQQRKGIDARNQLMARHAMLQAVADPAYLAAGSIAGHIAGITQPGSFDITQYTAQANAGAYAKAGVGSAAWSANTAQAILRQATANTTSTGAGATTAYAWQGDGKWTLQTLTLAKQQGYSTVIADSNFDGQDVATVHTGKYVVPTGAGDVTVLVQQRELSALATGTPTSKTADSEGTAAGRLARFMAQSAFYQMEQPYMSRNLLVCFGTDTSAHDEDALMSAVEQAPWLNLSDLNTLKNADAFMSGSAAAKVVPTSSGLSAQQTNAVTSTLQTLATTRSDMKRFATAVLTTANQTVNGSKSNASSSASSNGNVQALARQDAAATALCKDASAWVTRMMQAHDDLALHALAGGGNALPDRMAAAARDLSARLLGGVRIIPSESVTVVSETASMPVTVSNTLPYPVSVRVSSLTDSMEIVTSRLTNAQVPARGEEQVTFTIRVSTSGGTTAHLTLQDRNGGVFSTPAATRITSSLQINDQSGQAIIAAAVVLGIVGLWRQLHRKPSEES